MRVWEAAAADERRAASARKLPNVSAALSISRRLRGRSRGWPGSPLAAPQTHAALHGQLLGLQRHLRSTEGNAAASAGQAAGDPARSQAGWRRLIARFDASKPPRLTGWRSVITTMMPNRTANDGATGNGCRLPASLVAAAPPPAGTACVDRGIARLPPLPSHSPATSTAHSPSWRGRRGRSGPPARRRRASPPPTRPGRARLRAARDGMRERALETAVIIPQPCLHYAVLCEPLHTSSQHSRPPIAPAAHLQGGGPSPARAGACSAMKGEARRAGGCRSSDGCQLASGRSYADQALKQGREQGHASTAAPTWRRRWRGRRRRDGRCRRPGCRPWGRECAWLMSSGMATGPLQAAHARRSAQASGPQVAPLTTA